MVGSGQRGSFAADTPPVTASHVVAGLWRGSFVKASRSRGDLAAALRRVAERSDMSKPMDIDFAVEVPNQARGRADGATGGSARVRNVRRMRRAKPKVDVLLHQTHGAHVRGNNRGAEATRRVERAARWSLGIAPLASTPSSVPMRPTTSSRPYPTSSARSTAARWITTPRQGCTEDGGRRGGDCRIRGGDVREKRGRGRGGAQDSRLRSRRLLGAREKRRRPRRQRPSCTFR